MTFRPPRPNEPEYYPAPHLLAAYASEFNTQGDAADALGVTPSELSTWIHWRQKPGLAKREQVEDRSGGRVPRAAWLTKAERESAEHSDAN